mmetsp:Transcript_61822/g.152217  ORF Transcript_61822/g.152217 Transcript_61822/m.152217 type:complete len:217 (-) Transcript_61822:1276-1926(-)
MPERGSRTRHCLGQCRSACRSTSWEIRTSPHSVWPTSSMLARLATSRTLQCSRSSLRFACTWAQKARLCSTLATSSTPLCALIMSMIKSSATSLHSPRGSLLPSVMHKPSRSSPTPSPRRRSTTLSSSASSQTVPRRSRWGSLVPRALLSWPMPTPRQASGTMASSGASASMPWLSTTRSSTSRASPTWSMHSARTLSPGQDTQAPRQVHGTSCRP